MSKYVGETALDSAEEMDETKEIKKREK